jgi:hypothetical protein
VTLSNGSVSRSIAVLKRWCRSPLWLVQLATGAKSFADNPILGSPNLNRRGLHVARLKAAHALATRRRARLAHLVAQDLREEFDRNGFVVIKDYLPSDASRRLSPYFTATFPVASTCRVIRSLVASPLARRSFGAFPS